MFYCSQLYVSRQGEQGAALIVVLGLVAIISGWAAASSYEDLVAIRRAANMQDSHKAELACLSALELVKVLLREDAKDTQSDSLEEDWAQDAPSFPVDDGLVSAEIKDANRFLNINDLVDKAGKAKQESVTVFQNLFRQLDIDVLLVDALVDWLDKDSQSFGAGGAEDSSYYDKAYQVKNAPMDRVEELLFVIGFTPSIVRVLKPFLVVRGSNNGVTRVNINTASQEVLLALFPSLDMQSLENGRPYMVMPAQNTVSGLSSINYTRLSVQSDAFLVHTRAIFGRADRQENYFLLRGNNKVSLVWRERMIWQP